ncbi:MAG: hypothetical protein KDD45_18410, partial [Bdellovibrionales bacterium]|nr:hypothetical protein [Bdellovibrionales bacterium]
ADQLYRAAVGAIYLDILLPIIPEQTPYRASCRKVISMLATGWALWNSKAYYSTGWATRLWYDWHKWI